MSRKIVQKGDRVKVKTKDVDYYDGMHLPEEIIESHPIAEVDITAILIGRYQYEVTGVIDGNYFSGKVEQYAIEDYLTTECKHQTTPIWHDTREEYICPFCLTD